MILILISIFENIEFSAGSNAIGNAYYGIYDQSISFNPALTGINRFCASADYEKLYSIADIGRFYVSYKNIGFTLYYRKIEELQIENILSLSLGIMLNEEARLGFRINGFYLYQKELNSDYSFGVDIGFHTKLWRLWNLGFVIKNINKPSFGVDKAYYVHPKFGFGFSYEPSKYILTSFGFEKELEKEVRFLYGNILKISDNLILQAGFHTSPLQPTFGLKIITNFVSFNLAYIYHNELPSNFIIGVEHK